MDARSIQEKAVCAVMYAASGLVYLKGENPIYSVWTPERRRWRSIPHRNWQPVVQTGPGAFLRTCLFCRGSCLSIISFRNLMKRATTFVRFP